MSSALPVFILPGSAVPCISHPCPKIRAIPYCSCNGEESADPCVHRPCTDESLKTSNQAPSELVELPGKIKKFETAPHPEPMGNQDVASPPVEVSLPDWCSKCGPPPPGEDCVMWSLCYTEPPNTPTASQHHQNQLSSTEGDIPFCVCGKKTAKPCIPIDCNEDSEEVSVTADSTVLPMLPNFCDNCGPPPPGEDCVMWSPCYTEPPSTPTTSPSTRCDFILCVREGYQ